MSAASASTIQSEISRTLNGDINADRSPSKVPSRQIIIFQGMQLFYVVGRSSYNAIYLGILGKINWKLDVCELRAPMILSVNT